MKKYAYTLFITLFFFHHCTHKIPDDALATVNGDIISVDDFTDTYTQLILYSNTVDSDQMRLNHLNRIIDSYLFAQESGKTDPATDTITLNIQKVAEREKVRELLLEKEIASDINPPEEKDLKQLYVQKQQKYLSRHLFAKTKDDIDSLKAALDEGVPFGKLAYNTFSDTAMKLNGGSLGWTSYGELDPFLEDQLFQMNAGDISDPVESRFGWHILKLENRSFNPILTDFDFEMNKEKLGKEYIKREQDKRYYRYINTFMDPKTAVIKNPEYTIMIRALNRQFPADKKLSPLAINTQNGPQIEKPIIELADIMDHTVIEFDDYNMTVRDFLTRIPAVPTRTVYKNKRQMTEIIIKNYFLTAEGYKQGMGERPEVNNHITFRKNLKAGAYYIKNFVNQSNIANDTVSTTELKAIYEKDLNRDYIENQTYKYSSLVVLDSATKEICDQKLKNSIPMKALIDNYGILKAGGLESGHFIKTKKELSGFYYQNLIDLKDGELSDWININNRYIILKRHDIQTEYIPFDSVTTKIEQKILNTRRNNKLASVTDSLRQAARIQIDEEKLLNLWK